MKVNVSHTPRPRHLFCNLCIAVISGMIIVACHSRKPAVSEEQHPHGSPTATPASTAGESAALTHSNHTQFKAPTKIVLVLLDALRPDYLGFVDGTTPETAPGLAKLSRNAMVFARAFSTSSWTAPSVSSIYTSLYPPGHGIQYGFKAQRSFKKKYGDEDEEKLALNRLPAHRRILSEYLQDAGYDTFAITTNINISRHLGFNRGFGHFKYIPYDDGPAEVVLKQLAQWQPEIHAAAKSFVYLHLNDVHQPYHVRRPWFTGGNPKEDDAGRYRSEIHYADNYLQKMFKLLDVDDDTLLVVMSDHGEEFWDHGGTEHGPKLYQELVRVLLMIRWPNGGVVPGRTDLNVSHIDILPTLMDFVGIQRPDWFEGTTLVPLLRNTDNGQKALQLSHRALFAHRVYSKIRELYVTALILGKWKLINRYDKHFELYFHTDDPGDHHNLATVRPQMLAHLKARLDTLSTRLNEKDPYNNKVEIKIDEDLLERLGRLGYTTESDKSHPPR